MQSTESLIKQYCTAPLSKVRKQSLKRLRKRAKKGDAQAVQFLEVRKEKLGNRLADPLPKVVEELPEVPVNVPFSLKVVK